ncbi:MAG: exo-alpha-sialidase, partial [Deltaproteobacteria bacterium]|nr:exo-alpha-sialidase [Deltaproteobacteria bacterium]
AQKQGKAFNGTSLYYTWSDDGGRSFHPDKKIADSTCQCCRLQTAFDKDGLPVVIWRHIFHDNIRDHALVKFEDWSRPAPLVRLSRENWRIDACPHHGPGLSIGEDGRYHAVWFNNAPEFHGLFYAYSNDHGQHFSVPLRFGDYEKGAAHPHVLSQGEKVTVVWKEFDGKSTRILSMESPDGGVSWYDPKIVARTSGSSDNPFLLTDSEHRYLSWQTEKEGYRLLDLDQNALAFKNP